MNYYNTKKQNQSSGFICIISYTFNNIIWSYDFILIENEITISKTLEMVIFKAVAINMIFKFQSMQKL